MSKNMSEKLKTPEVKLSPADLDFEKLNGLLPVIAPVSYTHLTLPTILLV